MVLLLLLPPLTSDPSTSTLVAELVGSVPRTLLLKPEPLAYAALLTHDLPYLPSPQATGRISYPSSGSSPLGPRGVPSQNPQKP